MANDDSGDARLALEAIAGEDLLAPTPGDAQLALVRTVLAAVGVLPAVGPIAASLLEVVDTPTGRQHARAIRTLARLVQELQSVVTSNDWRRAMDSEEFDSAVVRAWSAAHEAQVEAKRELIWLALINGWVRTGGDPERDRFLRIVAKYDVEHFQALERLKALAPEPKSWPSVEGEMLPAIGGDQADAHAYVQEFDADGLVRIYDQPRLREEHGGRLPLSVMTDRIALWTERADRLLGFVKHPGAEKLID
ncbi:hypothetical protein [Microbacterium sp. NPDC080220]|uniref:hypothetical protein n=1 Tax=Microbacterium sp. NPDC080220 TaxID=3161017 RepID=UPI0034160052